MTPVVKSVLALGVLCIALFSGALGARVSRTKKHYWRLQHAALRGMHGDVVAEYHHLTDAYRRMPLVKSEYEKSSKIVGDRTFFDVFPVMETADGIALALLVAGLVAFWAYLRPRPRRKPVPVQNEDWREPPTPSQVMFIKRLNHGVLPLWMTRASAREFIKRRLASVHESASRQRIDISPSEVMSCSRSHRESMKVERERKRAQERLERQKAQERRREEREAQRAQKEETRRYEKRRAEEERLLKVRDEARSGAVHKPRNAKAEMILEFQNLVNDILADKKIEPQEVRQLKAWLTANRKNPGDFASMLKVIDESLEDGIIDADETQAIYEGVIDCLITLRER